MALLHESTEDKKMDTRVVERNINKGAVSPAELAKSLSSLPDDSANAEYTNIELLAQMEDVKKPSSRH